MPTTAADIQVRAVMTGSTGLPEDIYINDFAFRFDAGGVPTDVDIVALFNAVDRFYNGDGVVVSTPSDFIGQAVSRAATHELQAFTISVGGSPRFTQPWLGPAAPTAPDNNLPTEVSGVLSFHAELTGVLEEAGATRPRARRRGRVYVGPLAINSCVVADDNPMLNTTFTGAMRTCANLMGDFAELAGWTWSVWSRADNELYPIVGGWTDNAPDTQRRRGVESTARVTFTR